MVRKNYRELLRKGSVLQSWKGLNLYNLSIFRNNPFPGKNFYQKKWKAKAIVRTYHGRHVREKKWQLMFNRRLPAVVEMDPRELAKDDGSRHAAGRGSGLANPDAQNPRRRSPRSTPYMNMTFWPLERRLDTAIFRAMFASSIRMARQYVVHGHVKVNGKKMKHPSYLLNPGDMFTVNPEMVLLGTGLKNTPGHYAIALASPNSSSRPKKITKKEEGESAETEDAPSPDEPPAMGNNKLRAELKLLEEKIAQYTTRAQGGSYVFRTRRERRLAKLRKLHQTVQEAVKATAADDLTAASSDSTAKLKNYKNILYRHQTQSDPVVEYLKEYKDSNATLLKPEETDASVPRPRKVVAPKTHLELLKDWPNKRRQDKPYLTPWEPRNWMSAFAFIPRYLEVNQNVCSAVYLRHPVARQGLAEVPSPFDEDMSTLAYQWYLRRR